MRDGALAATRAAAVVSAGALLGVPVPASGSQANKPPVFPTAVETVRVDVVVSDSTGQAVKGLRRDDFIVREDGVSQEVVDFEAIEEWSQTDAAQGQVPAVTIAGAAVSPDRPATFLVAFDEPHLTPEEARTARAFVLGLLKTVRRGDRVTLVAMHDGRWWSGVGPAGVAELARQLDGLNGRRPRAAPDHVMSPYEAMRIVQGDREVERVVERRFEARQGLSEPEGFDSGANEQVTDPHVQMHARTVLADAMQQTRRLLEQIVHAVRGLPSGAGRRTLLIASGGFLVDAQLAEYRELVLECLRSRVSIYFYDARDLVAGGSFGAETAGRVSGTRGGLSRDYERRRDEEHRLQTAGVDGDASGAMLIAEETGGFTVRASDASGLARLQRDARQYYLLGYLPSNTSRDGKLRRIEVEVRRNDLSVRARKAYFAPTGADQRASAGVVSSGPSAAKRDGAVARYLALIDGPDRPDVSAGIDRLREWSPRALRETAVSAATDASCARECRRSAVVLHTEAAFRYLEAGESGAADTQRDIAAELVRRSVASPGEDDFERIWLHAMAEKELDLGRIPDAIRLFDMLVKRYPEDAKAHLARGRAHEGGLFILSLVSRPGRIDSPPLSSAGFDYRREHARRGVIPSPPAEEAHQRSAVDAYRDALRLDPSLIEARLRLGRVLWLGGRHEEAVRELAAVASPPATDWSYLAHLFLSRVEEERGRLPESVIHARAAAALRPSWQAGQLALADLLLRSGKRDEALQLVALIVGEPHTRASEDAWVLYRSGAYDRAAQALGSLRAMIRP